MEKVIDYTFKYCSETDVLRINKKNRSIWSKDNEVDSDEIRPGIWVIFDSKNPRSFLRIEILGIKKRNYSVLYELLKLEYDVDLMHWLAN